MTDPTPSFEDLSVAAILAQRGRADIKELLDDLVTMLSQTVPAVQVERALFRRHVTSIRLPLGGYVYLLKRNSDDRYDASRQQVVRGVAVRTFPMEIDAFLAELGLALDVELRQTEKGREALRAWMNSSNS